MERESPAASTQNIFHNRIKAYRISLLALILTLEARIRHKLSPGALLSETQV